MQKKIIALAVAGLMSGAAFAQSNVEIYGVVDAYYANASADGSQSLNVVNSGGLSGSRIGFKGTEKLSNDLTALFVLEYALANDANAGIGSVATVDPTAATAQAVGNARQQLLGLTGSWGTFVAGRAQTTAYDFSLGGYNALAGSAIDPHARVTAGSLITASSRADNAIAYISPNFSGFTVAVNHARLDETSMLDGAVTENANANLLSATYANGPLKAGYVYSKYNNVGNVATTDNTENALGVSYDFGVAKAGLTWQDNKAETAATSTKNKSWLASVSVPVSAAGAVHVVYANRDDAAADMDAKGWSLAYTHGLSKRTTAYAGYTSISNDLLQTKGTALQAPTAGGDAHLFAVGMRHSF